MEKFKDTTFHIIPTELLESYCQWISANQLNRYKVLNDSELSIETFEFYTSVSAVFSSKIEGENIDLDSYIKHKRFGIDFQPDYTKKIDDLYSAYEFAGKAHCNEENITIAHEILTQNILPYNKQGIWRTGNMYVTTEDGRIEYVAASPYLISAELHKFYKDLHTLGAMKLTIQEIFFFASWLHMIFVKIHPFNDGNGRISRLIEKWFLAGKLGAQTWLIQSEKYYYLNHSEYYRNIRSLGLEYEELDYSNALPFLLMLPKSLTLSKN